MKSIEKYIAWLEDEIGYLEKKSNSQLDDKTANAGNKNFTKYARDLDALGWYNGKKNGYSWCCVFPDAGRYHCFGMETALAMVGQKKGGLGAGVKYMAQYYKAIGRLFFKDPQRGDQVIFARKDKQGNVTSWLHTEIVTKVEGGKVYTIGGNTSVSSGVISNGGGVFRKSYSINDPKIYGYGRPLWDLAEKQMKGDEVDMTKEEIQKMVDDAVFKQTPIYNIVEECPEWSREAVSWAVKSGYIQGDGTGKLNLDNNKVWAIKMAYNIMNKGE